MKQKEIAGKVGISSSSVCKYLKSVVVRPDSANKKSVPHKLYQGLDDEITKRKAIIDKLTDEIDIFEKTMRLMGEV